MEELFIEHFSDMNLDIRASGDARFMDQKVTPDVLCINADIVVNYVRSIGDNAVQFTAKDIWEYDYANENVRDIFQKPDVHESTAVAEYNKFFQQPLKMLSYAGVLRCTKIRGVNNFQVLNTKVLEAISIKERNSLLFLQFYLEKVMLDSDLWGIFKNFFERQDRHSFQQLKTTFENFIREHTAIEGVYEPRRIFTKIINPLAFKYNSKGTKGGRMSPQLIGYDELMYNRRNWRDVEKKRGETRQEYEDRAQKRVEAYTKYTVSKAKQIVRQRYYPVSEVSSSTGDSSEATQVHHIFMESEFPAISTYTENLILLTPNQHFLQAHPGNNTGVVDRDFQLVCLLAKNESIEHSIGNAEVIYSIEDYSFVLKTGLGVEFSTESNFSTIRSKIADIYNKG